MITVEEYAHKVEVFVDMWRNKLISDIELVENVHKLESDVMIIDGNDQHGYYAIVPSSRILPQTPQG